VPTEPRRGPIRLALVDDYEVVLRGVADMFADFRDRVVIVEIDATMPLADATDVVLYDSFAQSEADHDDIDVLIRNPRARRVVVYTWNFHQDLIESALRKGASGYLSKTLTAVELVDALERVHAGETVVSPAPARQPPPAPLDWPGRLEGLTEREAEVLALITQGHSNTQIAALMFLSINSIKSYIRTTYRKLGVTSRTEAVLWGVDHGFRPDHHRIDHWRGGP
jgi:DNA-binding NarL/FixJ family response regulator